MPRFHLPAVLFPPLLLQSLFDLHPWASAGLEQAL
jgi:hypothetical protein